ncbi:MAG: adenine phosphoribosyltransferase [Lachnospiraceae bacterium]
MAKELKDYVVTIPDFPAPGVMFRDVTSVIQDPDGLQLAIDTMQDLIKDLDYDVIIGAESRGFIFGAPIAYNQHKSLVLARKKGKLPRKTVSETYSLEYGTATLEIHADAIKPGQKVLVVDDLIATGGTVEAILRLVKKLGGEPVGVLCLMELAGLKGREALAPVPVYSAITYEGK